MERPTIKAHDTERSKDKPPRRPLRTYSKRPLSNDGKEPVSKKRRVEAEEQIVECQVETTQPTRPPYVRQPIPAIPPATNGSILSYFKIMPSARNHALSSTEPSPEPSSELAEPTSTPPSSPPMPNIQLRKRRRLTTRVPSRATSEDLKCPTEPTRTDEEITESHFIGDHHIPVKEKKDTLSDVSADTLNQKIPLINRSEAGRRARASKSATVQTTLSLSADEKGFTECKQCNMLYNPLHKQDAKFHAKRHAAILKAKSDQHDNDTSG
ncbi:uncharacterized protein GGS25DRAFT_81096 [Hypoxylon fragiforme]|uniref:uncharacterized protein n=1 Tax=Hypoxylon fragiforme TaxID=63214 RepID=UPI0020C6B003|nr:uncharacterized protein GGS25DRAFT_81096 [Hypoxylon fragiforme]KAI2603142.1 hypothetical protein GGS25DRAFT_81096 [Hypoxylon fragiforme]